MPRRVTDRNFTRAQSAHFFAVQARRSPVNRFHHEREPLVESAIRPDPDVLHSHAVVDVSERATVSLAPSDEYQADVLVDEAHHVLAVVGPGESVTVAAADLTRGTHLYVLGRTSVEGGLPRANELQDLRRIEAATSYPYRARAYDAASRRAVAASLARRAAEVDLTRAFGSKRDTDRDAHLVGTAIGWGSLPAEHGVYFEAVATSSGCEIWTFEPPPVDPARGSYSVLKFDDAGRLDPVLGGYPGRDLARNGDGSISIRFGGPSCAAHPNVIPAAPGERFRYAMRIRRPRRVDHARAYVAALRAQRLETVPA
ncbi:murein transglycosylase [Agromyces luteolus]|uniref:DUF1254 domain-containing protein n=1 Tax=Agromyces luteolus TaxID=88373 RepID=A0A7C9LIR9_9MICO|nr:hypothetical protein [Agromyces luteolus]MUN08114.1 hypothetical protein [Agromyces luteolus]GLK27870.1 murein transglycosylase [Agromyces luteolus]